MKLDDLTEKILTRVTILTDIEIFVTDKEKLIYYLGNVDRVCEYLYSEISDDLKRLKANQSEQKIEYSGEETIPLLKCDMDKMQNEIIYQFEEKGEFDKFLIFAKTNDEMNAEDRFLIESATNIIQKYL